MRKVGDIFTRRKVELARIMTREMESPPLKPKETFKAIDTAYYAASETRRLFGNTVPSEMNNKMNLSFRTPIGVVGVITAWDFLLPFLRGKFYPLLPPVIRSCSNPRKMLLILA